MRRHALVLLLAALGLSGCDFPQDSEGALDRVRSGGVLRVGAAENDPWIIAEGEGVRGLEAEIVAAFAGCLGARVEWTRASEAVLVEALRGYRLDMMVGGLSDASPWKSRIGMSRPYMEAAVVVAVPRDGPAGRRDWTGARIGFPPSRPHFAVLIEEAGAVPVQAGGEAVALYGVEAARRGLVATPAVLKRERRVMAVAPGENALLLALDRFLATAPRRPSGRECAP